MNKNRPRTQRRLKARQALSARYRGFSGAPIAVPRKTKPLLRRSIQSQTADRTPVTLALDFEVQTKDKSGRWRKTAGQPRVHTFGLARLRAHKLDPTWTERRI